MVSQGKERNTIICLQCNQHTWDKNKLLTRSSILTDTKLERHFSKMSLYGRCCLI